MTTIKRKLIEVSLPLEAINRESAREKSIRHGHPSNLHLWWARRPLAACRAILFAQLVDDPSSHPDRFPTEADQATERQRLFDLIERLVVWENVNDEALLKEAHDEILKSTNGIPPTILDPFAGGGSIPLEAQRLGLRAYASDLNPVAVLINRALIDIPPTFVGLPPVFPGSAATQAFWSKTTGLAEDVLRYGQLMRDQVSEKIGDLYPRATLADGSTAGVIAWIWARTVTCPNPACGLDLPLVRSWWLGRRKGKEAYVVPTVVTDSSGVRRLQFAIGSDPVLGPRGDEDGTVGRTGARCVSCGSSMSLSAVREAGQRGTLGVRMIAVVAEGDRRRHYLAPTEADERAADVPRPASVPEPEMPEAALGFRVQAYGIRTFADLFTPRQLTALSAFSESVADIRGRVLADAKRAGLADDGIGLDAGGSGATAYADAIAIYLSLCVGKAADMNSSHTVWKIDAECPVHVFGRQAIPMVWDFPEANPLGESSGSWVSMLRNELGAIRSIGTPAFAVRGLAEQADAASRSYRDVVVSTDPPYYDNVPYADLSDFFYGWLRMSLREVLPNLFDTVQTPKAAELVADPHRRGGKQAAGAFFETGFNKVFANMRAEASTEFPATVFYAFKQSDTNDDGTASTGWQTLLEGMLASGWEVTATWPVRTELAHRMRGQGSNALASSVVLALRPRSGGAEALNRRGFISALKGELPQALKSLQQGSIAPVDLAQAAIGPGMAIFSRYSRVVEADGSDMSVRTALALINQALDEVLSKQEGDFDVETRFAVKWFSQYGWNDAASGEADVLSRAVDTTVATLERGGIFRAAAGKARLLEPADMPEAWNPADDKFISVWEVAVRLGHALLTEGLEHAAAWMRDAAVRVDLDSVKELSYLMYSVAERKGWAESAMLFNALGSSWGEVVKEATQSSRGTEVWLAMTMPDGEDQ